MNIDYDLEKIEAYLIGETSASEAIEIEKRIATDAEFAAQVKVIEALINGIRQYSVNDAKKNINSAKRNEYLEKTLEEIEHKIKIEKLKNLETRMVASAEEIGLHSYYISRQQENISLQNSEKQAEKTGKRRKSTFLLYLITIGIVIAGFTFLLIPVEPPSINGYINDNYIEKDSDNDGYNDIVDECPNERGECRGCLCSSKVNDSDKDNIPDEEDKCPDDYGIKALNGCPENKTPASMAFKDSNEIEKDPGDVKVYWENDKLNAYRAPEDTLFLKLSYGIYKGEVKNRKPHGQGELQYNSKQLISPSDPEKRYAKAGDYIEGVFYNGYLTNGKWFDRNNNLKAVIIIGRWGG